MLVSKFQKQETILNKKFHRLVIDVHLSFINSGADVIVTNTFSSRKFRQKSSNKKRKT